MAYLGLIIQQLLGNNVAYRGRNYKYYLDTNNESLQRGVSCEQCIAVTNFMLDYKS
jgi:hypothetical protein